jgi:hypothetical protein
MRTTLTALSLAAGLGVIACQSAAALPVAPEAIQQAATAASNVEQAQCRAPRPRYHDQVLS